MINSPSLTLLKVGGYATLTGIVTVCGTVIMQLVLPIFASMGVKTVMSSLVAAGYMVSPCLIALGVSLVAIDYLFIRHDNQAQLLLRNAQIARLNAIRAAMQALHAAMNDLINAHKSLFLG